MRSQNAIFPSFLGVAKILCVEVDALREGADKDNLTKEDIEIRPFEDVVADMIDKFDSLGRSERRNSFMMLFIRLRAQIKR